MGDIFRKFSYQKEKFMSKWKSYLPIAIIILVGIGAYNIADSVRLFRPKSMAIGCSILIAVLFLYKIWSERPPAKQSNS